MNTEMTDYVHVYDNVGRKEQATSAFTSDVTYAKLSPETLIKKRTVSEQYQVPARESGSKRQKRSGLFIAAASVLLTLLSVGTIAAVILASVEFQHITKLSIQNIELTAKKDRLSDELQELKSSMVTMKEEITASMKEEIINSLSYNKCFKETRTCSLTPRPYIIKPYCETLRLLVNQTVSCNTIQNYRKKLKVCMNLYYFTRAKKPTNI